MTKKVKIYLDTSVISHLSAPDTPEKMSDTLALWEEIKTKKYDVVVSDLTFEEVAHCFEPKRTFLNNELDKIKATIAARTKEVSELAKSYVKRGGVNYANAKHQPQLHTGRYSGYSYLQLRNDKKYERQRARCLLRQEVSKSYELAAQLGNSK